MAELINETIRVREHSVYKRVLIISHGLNYIFSNVLIILQKYHCHVRHLKEVVFRHMEKIKKLFSVYKIMNIKFIYFYFIILNILNIDDFSPKTFYNYKSLICFNVNTIIFS